MLGTHLILDLYPEHSQKIFLKTQLKKWAKALNRYFAKEDIQLKSKHMRRCSTALVIKEMQTKTTMDTAIHLLE